MRIILSRKGFDDANGGKPSIIMPDNKMLSFPIPSDERDTYADLQYEGTTYKEIIKQLNKKFLYEHCHIDPDLTDEFRETVPENWKPAFGQSGAADSFLHNTAKVKPGDLFLFFGTFRMVEKDKTGRYRFVRKGKFPIGHVIHAIWGYLQVGEMLRSYEEMKEYSWHPHVSRASDHEITNETLYIPTETLSFRKDLPGCGVFDFDKKRVLTMEGKTKGIWKDVSAYRPENIIGNRKNLSSEGIYYQGIWQELPLKETKKAEGWAISLF